MQKSIRWMLLLIAALVLAVLGAGYGSQLSGAEVRPADLQARRDGGRVLLMIAGLTAMWLFSEVTHYRKGLRVVELSVSGLNHWKMIRARAGGRGPSFVFRHFHDPECQADYYPNTTDALPWLNNGTYPCRNSFQITEPNHLRAATRDRFELLFHASCGCIRHPSKVQQREQRLKT